MAAVSEGFYRFLPVMLFGYYSLLMETLGLRLICTAQYVILAAAHCLYFSRAGITTCHILWELTGFLSLSPNCELLDGRSGATLL